MSTLADPSFPGDLVPGYCCHQYNVIGTRQQRSSSFCGGYISHFIAMLITVSLCFGVYYYYDTIYIPQQKGKSHTTGERVTNLMQTHSNIINEPIKAIRDAYIKKLDGFKEEINGFKEQLTSINNWRTTINGQITKLQWEQDANINNAIDEALDIYEADGIGEMGTSPYYAASYAGGTIIGISEDTFPYPSHRPLSLFKIVNFDLHSSPEEIIRPCVLPGSCFAFRGTSASIRIKLGRPINIGYVTISHASKRLVGLEGMASAPKSFEVYGFTTLSEDIGIFLGKFTYDWKGKQHQMFEIKQTYSQNQIFTIVELVILNNHGKTDFTCIYRFRVHKSDVKGLNKDPQKQKGKKKKNCCS